MDEQRLRPTLDALRRELVALQNGAYYVSPRKLNHATPDQLMGPSKWISCIQLLVKHFCDDNRIFLEFGSYRGLTLLAAASVSSNVECVGIDNFSQFDESGINLAVINAQISLTGLDNARLINADFDSAVDRDLPTVLDGRKVGAYFVDGAHDHRSQLMSMARLVDDLSDECAIIVDDTNYAHVRHAIADFLRIYPDFTLLMEAYVPIHPANLAGRERGNAFRGWWNGVNVLVRDRNNAIPRRLPQDNHSPFLTETHDIFRHEFAEIALDVLKSVQSEADTGMPPVSELVSKFRSQEPRRYPDFNVQSRDLSLFEIQ